MLLRREKHAKHAKREVVVKVERRLHSARPENCVRRAEFAELLNRLANLVSSTDRIDGGNL
jgi:hypothetical protein